MSQPLHSLVAGERLIFGGNRVTTVPAELADQFRAGDRLVVVHETGDLLHIRQADHATAAAAVGAAAAAFAELTTVSD